MSAAFRRVLDEVLQVWNKPNIATRAKPKIVAKPKNIHQTMSEPLNTKKNPDTDYIGSWLHKKHRKNFLTLYKLIGNKKPKYLKIKIFW